MNISAPFIRYPIATSLLMAGILFVGLGATGLTLATSWGGTTYPWNSPTIIGLFTASAAALGIFVWVESRPSGPQSAPILPTRLFANPVFTVCCVLSFVVGFAMLGALTFLPTYMQFVDGVSATTSGLRTLPMVAGMLSTSIGSGVLVGRTGRYKIFPVFGLLEATLSYAALAWAAVERTPQHAQQRQQGRRMRGVVDAEMELAIEAGRLGVGLLLLAIHAVEDLGGGRDRQPRQLEAIRRREQRTCAPLERAERVKAFARRDEQEPRAAGRSAHHFCEHLGELGDHAVVVAGEPDVVDDDD